MLLVICCPNSPGFRKLQEQGDFCILPLGNFSQVLISILNLNPVSFCVDAKIYFRSLSYEFDALFMKNCTYLMKIVCVEHLFFAGNFLISLIQWEINS